MKKYITFVRYKRETFANPYNSAMAAWKDSKIKICGEVIQRNKVVLSYLPTMAAKNVNRCFHHIY